jgi:hypothetical protein
MERRRASLGIVWAALLTLTGCMEPTAPWEAAPPQSPDTPSLAPQWTTARSRVDADTTAALLFFLVVAPCGLVGAWSLFWWVEHRKRAALEQAFDPRAPLADGPSVIVGQVELEEGATGPAIEVAVVQRGREWKSKQQWHHQWKETTRAVRVRPFWVRLFSGARVRVEPDEHVALRDDLSRTERRSRFDRVRFAELTPGETVHVTGTLFGASRASMGAAYRAAATEPVLRPSRLGPMVVSTERPGATSAKRASFYRAWLLGIVAVALALPTIVFPTVTVLGLTGQTVRAEPRATRHWQVYHKPKNSPGYYVQHYGLRSARVVDGHTQVLTDECSEALWSCVQAGSCADVPYTVSALSDDVVQLGVGAQLTTGRGVLLGLVAAALLLAFPLSVFNTRPWYLRSKVVDTASGPLPDFIAPTR